MNGSSYKATASTAADLDRAVPPGQGLLEPRVFPSPSCKEGDLTVPSGQGLPGQSGQHPCSFWVEITSEARVCPQGMFLKRCNLSQSTLMCGRLSCTKT